MYFEPTGNIQTWKVSYGDGQENGSGAENERTKGRGKLAGLINSVIRTDDIV